jgi:very-short-patch-repair endonuclease
MSELVYPEASDFCPRLRGKWLSVSETEGGSRKARQRSIRLRQSMTDAERILWSRLRKHQMLDQHFRRQHPIGPFIADFACVKLKLVVEVDGDTHGTDAQLAYDARRTHFMETRGWTVVRCYNVDVYRNLDGVLTQIGDAVHDLCQRSMTDTPLRGAPFDPSLPGQRRATSPASGGRKSIKETKPAKGERKPQ